MSAAVDFEAVVNEDGSWSALSRLCALQGSGEEVKPGEGPVLLQADVASITCKVYDLGTDPDAAGSEVTPAPTLTPAANLFDTLRTVGWPTAQDRFGYNFRHDVATTFVPTGGNWYRNEYRLVLDDGAVLWLVGRVRARRVATS